MNTYDFQDFPLWRDMNYKMLRMIDERYEGTIIVPMTLINAQYFDEIVTKLRADGVEIKHNALSSSAQKGDFQLIHIRSYEPADLEALVELMGQLGYPTTAEVMSSRMDRIEANPDFYTFVATCDNNVVGMAGVQQRMNYETDDQVTYISALVVNSTHRGRGIGRQLMRFVEEWAIHQGSSILYLTSGIKEERKRAHEFYRSYGFDLTGYRFVKKLQ